MSERLKNTLPFTLASGESVVLLHGLKTSRPRPLAPDVIFLPSPDLIVDASTNLSITLRNNGGVMQSGSILVEAWHTIERAFEDVNDEDLPVKPYVVVSVEGNGAPPIPAWPNPAPVVTTIYATATGSDDGKGTAAEPYRTFQRAVRDVPYIQMPGYQYEINITNLGVETLPDGYELPSWVSGRANSGDGFAVSIAAEHILAPELPLAQAVIISGTMPEDPETGMFSVNDPSKAWTPGALKGMFVQATSSENPDETGIAGVVHDNTATEIFVTSNEGADWTFPFSLMRCSATLEGNGTGAFQGAISVNDAHSLEIRGIAIRPIDPFGIGFSQQAGFIWLISCDLKNPFFLVPNRFNACETCNMTGPSLGGPTYYKSSRIADALDPFWIANPSNEDLAFFRGTVLDNCRTIRMVHSSSVAAASGFGGTLTISNVLIKNSIGDAIYWPGGVAEINGVKIENSTASADPDFMASPGNAITLRGGVLAYLNGVTGTGNAGVGVRVTDGAQAQINATTTVQGPLVTDQLQVGTLGPQAFPAAPYNVADAATFARAFDPTFV